MVKLQFPFVTFLNYINHEIIASHSKSSFDIILVNISTLSLLTDENVKLLLNLVKPKGKVVFSSARNDELESLLVLSGFVNVKFAEASNCE